MVNATFSAAISGAVAIVVAAMTAGSTYLLTKKREREADWRKMKLDIYRAYVIALSGTVKHNRTIEDQAKYSDAANSLVLVASPAILRALYIFQDAVADKSDCLDNLLNALRHDVDPSRRGKDGDLSFRLLSPLPNHTSGNADPPEGK